MFGVFADVASFAILQTAGFQILRMFADIQPHECMTDLIVFHSQKEHEAQRPTVSKWASTDQYKAGDWALETSYLHEKMLP